MNLPPNPATAFIKFAIGDYELSELPPQHILSFKHSRSTQEASEFTLDCYDDTAVVLEDLLAKGNQSCIFLLWVFLWGGISYL